MSEPTHFPLRMRHCEDTAHTAIAAANLSVVKQIYKWYTKDENINFEETGKQVEFVPEASGEIIIVLEVEDANGGKDIAETIVAVKEPQNAEPQVVDDEQVTDEDQPVQIPVLVNDSDEDGDDIKVVSTTQPKNGIVKIQENGTLLYTPNSS